MLRAARVMPGFVEAADIHLVEISPLLRAEQKERLKDHAVTWHEDFSQVPDGPLIVIANEFFDALPVHHYERTAGGWRERLVVTAPDGALAVSAAGAPLKAPPEWAQDAAPGAVIELSPERADYARRIATRLVEQGGAMLALDYGHAIPAPGETLQAVMRHKKVSPFHRPGEADLTAHVDFHALAVAMERAGAVCWGPVEQGDFLRAMGLAARYEMLRRKATARQRIILRRGVERIAGDEQMGRLFKVLAAASPGLPAPAPFEGEKG
jgi:NADH dehydrogenase [ubiquinone] 1 alpha subcomplex assembly factor 7